MNEYNSYNWKMPLNSGSFWGNPTLGQNLGTLSNIQNNVPQLTPPQVSPQIPVTTGKKSLTDKINNMGELGQMALMSGAGITGNVLGNALAGGKTSGVGNTIGTIGSSLGGIAGTVLGGPLGGIVGSFAGNLMGGVWNSMFGSKMNYENINKIENELNLGANYNSSANNFEELTQEIMNAPSLSYFSKSDIGSDGLFSNKASRKFRELSARKKFVEDWITRSQANAATNLQQNQLDNLLQNYAAYGGLLDINNPYSDGGKIYIKPENRGKFTALKERTGKSATWFKEHGTPAQKKMAIFALNARKWKHDDGGPLSSLVKDINKRSNADFVQRLLDPNRDYIQDWESDNIATHKLGWATDDKGAIVFPNVQRINGKLYDFTDPKNKRGEWDALDSAIQRGDTLRMSPSQAKEFTENYKKYYPKGATFKAFGGDLLANGVEWDNGITVINNGGTHEESPYEGVQMGVDPQGIPNLVEEGEVIWNDYVFSNRIPVPNAVRSKYKLRGAKNMTFADAAKKASKESEEMPNDNIAQRGLQDIMSKLAYEQEAIREKRNMKRQNRQYAKGGILGNLFEGDGSKPQKLKTYKNFTPITNDFYTPEYMNFWNRMNDPKYATEANKWLKRINSGEFGKIGGNTFTLEDIQRLAHDYKKGPVHEAYLKASQEYNRFNPSWIQEGFEGEFQPRKFDLSIKSVDDAKIAGLYPQENKKTKNPIDKVEDTLPPLTSRWFDETVLRYAPVVGSAIGLGQTLFNKPDYSRADALAQYAQNAGKVTPISYDPLGNYLTYRPNDVEYIANKMAAQAAATRRGIMNTSGGNRAMALAGLAAQDYSSQLAQAEAIRQADESNFNRGVQVETFNRGTNQYNSEAALKAAMANQEARLKASQLGLSSYSTAMQMKDAIDAQRNASINANLSSLFESLGNIGIDAANRRDRDFYINTVVPNLPIGEYARVYGKSKAKKEAKRRGYNDLEISNLFD